jgi:hypothetical protein
MQKNAVVTSLALALLGATSGQALAERVMRKEVIARAFSMTSLT